MKELTVIELSEQTGLTRSQIYHLNKKHNFINLNKKINYEYALPIITALTIKKAKKANEKNFRPILNMLILGAITTIGGTLLIIAWLTLTYGILKD